MLSRGIDIPTLDLVINYDLPMKLRKGQEEEEEEEKQYELDIALYLQRIGRTGRYVRKGVAISFFSPEQRELLADLEQHLEIELNPLKCVK